MNVYKHVLFCFSCYALCLFCGGSLSAQMNDAEKFSYVFHVLLMDYNSYDITKGEHDDTVFQFDTEGEVYQIALINQSMSRAFSYKGSPTLSFFKETGVTPEGEPIRTPMISADLGKPGTKIVVIVKASKDRYFSRVVDVGPQFVKANQVKMINFSDHIVKGEIGEHSFMLERHESDTLTLKGKDGHPLFKMLIAATDGEKPYVVARRRIMMRQADRKLILYHYKRGNTSRITFTEFVVPATSRSVENVSDEVSEQSAPVRITIPTEESVTP
ncbi:MULTISPECIES: hypothetical protein [unclassified Lentimonas]|uniref:hypothetical protein n=1 Tax=unclassified Lentimonas TaxID=2630993 RepID=UPI001322C827|nr:MULTISPECIES: hypothetical protein [unclassified Lentimonas]CAA6690725.1 Unannotated [Lentimonas sp. CC19]CAA6693335.1 Unannotated [Lentimonas sp. CC10]CAA7071814.1 Unannotated [Lentimonas sp. CC11]